MSGHSHRPTLKQSNKGFKSKHATKGSLKDAAKGRLASPTPSTHSKHSVANKASLKLTRLNAQTQKRNLSRATLSQDLKFFSTASGGASVPRVVTVLPIHEDERAEDVTRTIGDCLGLGEGVLEDVLAGLSTVEKSSIDSGAGVAVLPAPAYKTSLIINHLPPLSLYPALTASLATDYLVLLLSSSTDISTAGETLLRCLQGMIGNGVEIIIAVRPPQDASTGEVDAKRWNAQTRPMILKSLLSFTQYFFPTITKIHVLSPRPVSSTPSSSTPSSDASNLARALLSSLPLGSTTPTGKGAVNAATSLRQNGRGWIVAEEGDWRFPGGGEGALEWAEDQAGEGKGTLRVRGTIRGGRLSADRLVHIPGWGDYQIEKITSAPALPTRSKPHASSSSSMSIEPTTAPLSLPTEEADDLTALNPIDDMSNEQTWPTEEDFATAPAVGDMGPPALPSAGKGTTPKSIQRNGAAGEGRMKRVPKGMSAYQAQWLISDDEDSGDEGEEDGMDMDAGMDGEEMDGTGGREEEEEEETEMIEMDDSKRSEVFDDLDEDEEERQLATYQKQRREEHSTDLSFPDEIDTPRHLPASVRFQRYRGLKSFRTSPWDPYEDLPTDYARIFQFEDPERMRRRVEAQGRGEGVEEGTRVEVYVKGVERELWEARDRGVGLVVFGLLTHEHKQSVLHFAVQRNTEYEEPVKAKDPLIICVGPRRYVIRPIYSQHTRSGGNGVYKSERFLRPGSAVVATTYGPVVFGKQACLLLKESEGVPQLVAMGSFLNADPTRIIAKRIILSGVPFKVHKRTATIRYMFFNRDDINYFAPIELTTRYGKRGNIKMPLGTHGYFKAHFDSPIQQQDTIFMALYKRQYPKQMEEIRNVPSAGRFEEVDESMDVE